MLLFDCYRRRYGIVVAVVLIMVFAAGDWEAAGKRDAAKPSAEEEEEEGQDAYGEFEDLETGQCGSSRCLTRMRCCVCRALLVGLSNDATFGMVGAIVSLERSDRWCRPSKLNWGSRILNFTICCLATVRLHDIKWRCFLPLLFLLVFLTPLLQVRSLVGKRQPQL